MFKVGILSPFKKVGKTTLSIGLASKLANNGYSVLFFNFNNLNNENIFFNSNSKFQIKDYLNKKINLNKIIYQIHTFNFDLISILESDFSWLKSLPENNLNTAISKFFSDVQNKFSNKYDYCLFDFSNGFESLNNFFMQNLDYYLIVIDPKFYDSSTALYLLDLFKIYKKNKNLNDQNRFFVILSMFEKNNFETLKKVEEIKFIFKDHLLNKHFPKIEVNEILKIKNSNNNQILKINKIVDYVYKNYLKNIFNI